MCMCMRTGLEAQEVVRAGERRPLRVQRQHERAQVPVEERRETHVERAEVQDQLHCTRANAST